MPAASDYIGSMKPLHFLAAPVLWAALALPALAEKISLADLSGYLNGLKTAQTEFTQVNGDGTISTGTLFIRRPGRMRFEYNPPDKNLVIAGGGQVAIFDAKSNTGPEQYPLKRTPLNLILERNVDLARAKMVVGHIADETTTTVIAQDPKNPEYGSIRLIFTDNPIQLRQWVITDNGGGQTTVILGEMETGMTLSAFLFDITYETERRSR